MKDTDHAITTLLQGWADGDPDALDKLLPQIIEELRALARSHFRRESPGHTLQPTALINEIMMRLLPRRTVHWDNRGQFFKSASDLMRHVLIDYSRKKKAIKRGGGRVRIASDEVPTPLEMPGTDYEELYDALDALDPEYRELVELKYFFGCTHEEIAKQNGISSETVKKNWAVAKVRLYRELDRD